MLSHSVVDKSHHVQDSMAWNLLVLFKCIKIQRVQVFFVEKMSQIVVTPCKSISLETLNFA